MTPPIALKLGIDGWVATIQAAPATTLNRRDALLGSLLYLGGAAIGAYLAALVGAVAGAGLEHLGAPWPVREVCLVVAVGLMVLGVARAAAAEALRRSLVYTLTADRTGLGVEIARTGAGAMIPVGLEASGALHMPRPWPQAIQGDPQQFRIPWTTLRSLSLEPHGLIFALSAERVCSLAIRGHTYEDLQPLEQLIASCVRHGDAREIPEALRELLTSAPTG